MQGRLGASMRGCGSRMAHSFRNQSCYSGSKYTNNSRAASYFSNKFQQNHSHAYGIPTTTMTMHSPSSFYTNEQTPNCMVYSSIGITSTMQEGTHLIGFGSSSSVVSGT